MKNGYVYVKNVLNNKTFHIPTLQRGYRWEEENVRQLLDDIYENKIFLPTGNDAADVALIFEKREQVFNLDDNKMISEENPAKDPYCIQPLVVCNGHENHHYDVIDGQQRLTTIIIILKAMNNLCSEISIPDVTLEYQSRGNSGATLKFLGNSVPEEEELKDDIDFEYMNNSYDVAKKFFETISNGFNDVSKTFFFQYLLDILLKNTRFIWYCIDTSIMDRHEVFANFNSGKIDLTESELIKAVFMDKANYDTSNIDDKRIVISEKWDEIENALHNPDFWAFVPHRKQYEDGGYDTRIDVIFELFIMMMYINEKFDENGNSYTIESYLEYRKANTKERYIFDEIESWIKKRIKKGVDNNENKNDTMNECWYNIRKIYLGLLELYEVDNISKNSNKIYNMVGLYINLMNKAKKSVSSYTDDKFRYFEVYGNLCEVMKAPRFGIDNRKERLKKLICSALGLHANNIENDIKRIRHTYSKEDKEEVDKNEEKVVNTLLAYNIALLNNSDGIGQRFDFRSFANFSWQREHIFACDVDDTKNTKSGLDTAEERRTALNILSKDVGWDSGKKMAENSYVEYVKNVYFYEKEFPPILPDLSSQLNFDDESQVKKFLENDYSKETPNWMLARALKTISISKKMLLFYDYIQQINLIKNMNSQEEKNKGIYNLLKMLERKFVSREFLSIDEILQKQLDGFPKKPSYTIEIGNFSASVGSNRTLEDVLDDVKSRFSDYIRNLYMEDLVGNQRADDYTVKDISKITKWEELSDAMEICLKTLNNNIDLFFEKEFAGLLKDNTMGNMTLLTGGKKEDGQSQNQVVSNEPYKLKKEHVRNFLKDGQFVPLGTLMVFSDTYNDSAFTSNFWLPDSRNRYLGDLISSLKKFLEPVLL